MKLVGYLYQGKAHGGVLSDDGERVFPFAAYACGFDDMNGLFERLWEAPAAELLQKLAQPVQTSVPFTEVRLTSPVPHPKRDVICLGLNYIGHSREMAKQRGEVFTGQRANPVYFSKRIYECSGDMDNASVFPELATNIDYGAELGVVIGTTCRGVDEAHAMDYVLGYTIINDLTIRDMDKLHRGPWMGKSVDGYLPMGPWIVTADEFERIPSLNIAAYVNDVMQQCNKTDAVSFLPDYIIADLSRGMTLYPGTILSTGSPGGELIGVDKPAPLHPGDVCRCDIEGIGSLRTIMTV